MPPLEWPLLEKNIANFEKKILREFLAKDTQILANFSQIIDKIYEFLVWRGDTMRFPHWMTPTLATPLLWEIYNYWLFNCINFHISNIKAFIIMSFFFLWSFEISPIQILFLEIKAVLILLAFRLFANWKKISFD